MKKIVSDNPICEEVGANDKARDQCHKSGEYGWAEPFQYILFCKQNFCTKSSAYHD